MKRLQQAFLLTCLLALLAAAALPFSATQAAGLARPLDQSTIARQKAKALLAKLSPEERVGQLFMVTFQGMDVSKKSQIYDLVVTRRVGGVMLLRANDNFIGGDRTILEAYRMIAALQSAAWDSSQATNPPASGGAASAVHYIPLFVGLAQEGDLAPGDQILSGMTPLPNQMAIGATWKPELAQKVGAVMGSELQALGVNLFLGPSLDVLDTPRSDSSDDLGTRTFGGDPYWVSEMGKAYITGLHQGSAQGGTQTGAAPPSAAPSRLVVVARHFPGSGGSDRPPEDEVATVRKSLEQLKQIELAPFFAVTGNAPSADATTDGLLVSHIRYQGFQGNIRATTRPVSFDPAALELILNLPAFSAWRAGGGVIVSDNLGSPAVRKFFDPTGKSFDARQIARSAFLAGNDLLYVNNFIASGDPDAYTTILRTLEFFTQKYREDAPFAQRIDASVERILTLKYKMYPDFSYDQVIPPISGIDKIGLSQQVTLDVARQSVTLVSPDAAELVNLLPRPPEARDRILFLSDTVSAKQCSTCSEQTLFAVDSLQSAVVRLYGPRAGGQVTTDRLVSYSMTDLYKVQTATKDAPPLIEDLIAADWIVVSIQKPAPEKKESGAFKRLLAERADLLRNKRVIVFAFTAPYLLDATDISKLTAYYTLYSKSSIFVDVAARILFQEMTPITGIPVSVPGVGYDLIQATSPLSTQVIPLYLDLAEGSTRTTPEGTPSPLSTPSPVTPRQTPSLDPTAVVRMTMTPEATSIPRFKVGDTIPLRTGVILDHNRHPVPDGTVVRFLFTIGGDSSSVTQVDTTTSNGIARARYRIDKAGRLEIRVTSDPATISDLLRLDITGGGSAAITVIAPTFPPTNPP
ncbi:MAG TPA: glycoside hydrolase family 3 N-terminal domain-containing protein, partial [Anaerolineaceae bacterium]